MPIFRGAQIRIQSKNSDNESNQTVCHTENARLLSKSAVFALWSELPRWGVVFRVLTGKPTYYRVLCPRCACAVQKRPPCVSR